MKLSSKSGSTPYTLLFCQLAAFSFAAAYAAAWICRPPLAAEPEAAVDHRQLFANYRLLTPFLRPPTAGSGEGGALAAEPLLAALGALEAAETSLAANDAASGLDALESVPERPSFLAARRDFLRLRLLRAARRFADAAAFTDARPPVDLEGRVLRLDCLMQTGRAEEAVAEFKPLFAGARLDAFSGALPRPRLAALLQRLGEEDWQAKFEFLLAGRDGREFRREASFCPFRGLARLFQAEFDFQRRAYVRARQALRLPLPGPYAGAGERLRLKIDMRLDSALDLGPRLRLLEESGSLTPGLLLDLGQIALAGDDLARALPLLERFLEESRDRNEPYWRTVWLLAWLRYRLQDRQGALKYFRLGSQGTLTGYRIASRYWLARMEKRQPPGLSAYPFSYYTVKALGSRDGFRALHIPFLDMLDDPPKPRLLAIVADLRALAGNGLWQEADEAVRWAIREPGLGAGDRNLLKVIESLLHYRQGRYFEAYRQFRANFPVPEGVRLPNFLSGLFFPRAYESLIESACREHGIDRYLVQSLIREESFFRREVRSPANALGLMQLLPATARQVAAQAGLRIKAADLFDPGLNIRLGLRYLQAMLRRYDGRVYLALAAYNAGPHRVDRWLKDFPAAGEEEFIEMIPFSETRNYVKSILRNRFFYRYYDGAAGA